MQKDPTLTSDLENLRRDDALDCHSGQHLSIHSRSFGINLAMTAFIDNQQTPPTLTTEVRLAAMPQNAMMQNRSASAENSGYLLEFERIRFFRNHETIPFHAGRLV